MHGLQLDGHIVLQLLFLVVTEHGLSMSAPRCDFGAMRLFGGSNDMEGQVQVCLGNTAIWSAVCGHLRRDEQNVLCREMGYLRNPTSTSKEVQKYS